MTTDPLLQNMLSMTPSLYSDQDPQAESAISAASQPRTLADLMHDGFYLLLLLKNRYVPNDADHFALQVRRFLDNFERQARRMNLAIDDVYAAKYAFCAAVDEAILGSNMPIRESWERAPLQLILFGDQLAGEHFFSELEQVRLRGAASVQALEVFYVCLLTGFQGKYRLEGSEKLAYLVATLGKEITLLKGKRAPFAPHWKSPDNVRHLMKAQLPLWVIGSTLTLMGAAIYAGLTWYLARHTNAVLGNYFDIIKLTPRLAHITVSLP